MSSSKYDHLPLSRNKKISCSLRGDELLNDPLFNKGSAFLEDERRTFGLEGRLPATVCTFDDQLARAYQQYSSRNDDLAKNSFMTSLKQQNIVLYFRLLHDHLKEMFSVVYTPTEGDAIENYSRLFRRPEGCHLDIEHVDDVESILATRGKPDSVDYIVVSDGEAILGIGDQGVGAVLISIAKLVLTTACAGIHPDRTLPVVLDCGTNNSDLLNDPLYLGLRRARVEGERYDKFVDTFVTSARKLFPKAYIHFEDFGRANARRILDRYRPNIACFNDDVQGTGCVTLAAMMAGLHIANLKLPEIRIVVFGAGSAGTGIADQIRDAIATEGKMSKEDAAKKIWCVDKQGILLSSYGDDLTQAQTVFARPDSEWPDSADKSLHGVIKAVKPHVLIGTSTRPKTFTKEVCEEMAKHVARPIIFPLSNPTRLVEADPVDINEWTGGKALIATGSPFPPVTRDGEQYEIAECNNSACFPGIGLGCVLSRARLLTDAMLVAACRALSAQAPAMADPRKALLPDIADVWNISVGIAKAVVKQAVAEGLAQVDGIPEDESELEEWIRAQMWEARYRELVPV